MRFFMASRQAPRRRARSVPLTVVLVATLTSPGLLPARAPSPTDAPTYAERLAAVESLAARFPGFTSVRGRRHEGRGLWEGIYLQTRWQMESGRDRFAMWERVNTSLTVLPAELAQAYDRRDITADGIGSDARPGADGIGSDARPGEDADDAQASGTGEIGRAPVTREDVRRAWWAFFQLHEACDTDPRGVGTAVDRRMGLVRALWAAHSRSVAHALWTYRDAIRADAAPTLEREFWKGWVRFVFLAEHLSPLTSPRVARPFLGRTMPGCAPLGSTGCPLEDLPASVATFVRLVRRGMPVTRMARQLGLGSDGPGWGPDTDPLAETVRGILLEETLPEIVEDPDLRSSRLDGEPSRSGG